jgi:hypothetical protein
MTPALQHPIKYGKAILLIVAISIMGENAASQSIAALPGAMLVSDTASYPPNSSRYTVKKTFPVKEFIVPAAMITYGFTSLASNRLKNLNNEIKDELWTEHPHTAKHIDNFLPFAPALTVYILNATGVRGKNDFYNRSMIYLLSNVITNVTVFSTKRITHQARPDASNFFSFPSGHTAAAFTSAEFLRQEYKDVSPWYGIAGYAVAATTGYLRMYNNKHWLSDVITGAGVGMASVKLAYWLYPKIQRTLRKGKTVHTIVLPAYQNGVASLALVHHF